MRTLRPITVRSIGRPRCSNSRARRLYGGVVAEALVDEIADQGGSENAALDDAFLIRGRSDHRTALRAAVVGRNPLFDVEDLNLFEAAADLFLELGESPTTATATPAVFVHQLALATIARNPRWDVIIQRAPTTPLAPWLVFRRLRLGFRRALLRSILDTLKQRIQPGERKQLRKIDWPTALGRARAEDHLLQLLDSM